MKAFVLKDGPFLKSKTKASQLKLTILVALIPLVLFAWVKNGIYPYLHHNMTFQQMCTPITMIGIVVLISTLSYYLIQKLEEEKMNHYKWLDILCSSLILVLLLPIQTPIYLLVIGSIAMAILESCEPLKKYVNPIIIYLLLSLYFNISSIFIIVFSILVSFVPAQITNISPLLLFIPFVITCVFALTDISFPIDVLAK